MAGKVIVSGILLMLVKSNPAVAFGPLEGSSWKIELSQEHVLWWRNKEADYVDLWANIFEKYFAYEPVSSFNNEKI